MRTALLGIGYWGSKLLRNLVDIAGPDGVVAVDPDELAHAEVHRQYPSVATARTLGEALADESVRAVVVATPVETHAKLATEAIEAGRHVLVEKPLAHNVAEATRLAQLADSAGVGLMVGHTFLFSPRVERIAEEVTSGRLGPIHYITSSRLNLGLHRSDANVIWDLAPHDFSIVMHLLGEAPVSAQTIARSVLGDGVPDVAFINLAFPSGAIASVDVSWLAPRKVRSTVIVGERRMVMYEDTNGDEPIRIYDKGIEQDESASFGENQLTYRYGDTVAPHVAATEPLCIELRHFLSCARTGQPMRSDGWFGVRVVEALAAADESWRRGGEPVEVRRAAAQVT